MNNAPENNQDSTFFTTQESVQPVAEPIDYIRPPETVERNETFARVSTILGIISIFANCCCSVLGVPLGIAAIVLAAVDKSQNGRFCGMSVAGLVCGIISVAMIFVVAVLYVLLLLLSASV